MIQEELTKVDDLDAEIRRVEDLRRLLFSIEDPLSGHYAIIPDEDSDGSLIDDMRYNENSFEYGFGYGSKETAAKRRQNFYRRMGMKVKVGEELEISLGIGETLVSKNGTPSG